MSNFLFGSICLSDIPQEHITISEKNGKKYLNIYVSQRKEEGKYGETHFIGVSVPKEKKKPNDDAIYIGNLKTWNKNSKSSDTPQEDDLPF